MKQIDQNQILENIAELEAARYAVTEHCMCRALRDDGCSIVVIYPEGDWPDGKEGIHCTYGVWNGQHKAWAFKKLLEQMEKDWLGSFPNPRT